MSLQSMHVRHPECMAVWCSDCCVRGAGSFSQPGLGGREGEVKELGVWGGNPSITWNNYLQRWLMVWHGWDPPNILLSHSQDLLQWAPAVRIVVVRLCCLSPVMCLASVFLC